MNCAALALALSLGAAGCSEDAGEPKPGESMGAGNLSGGSSPGAEDAGGPGAADAFAAGTSGAPADAIATGQPGDAGAGGVSVGGIVCDGSEDVSDICALPCEDVYGFDFDEAMGCAWTAEPEVFVGCLHRTPESAGSATVQCYLSPDGTVLVWAPWIGEPWIHLESLGWTDCLQFLDPEYPRLCR